MKILLGCINVNGLGGSELYHYELARELHALGQDITLFTLRDIDPKDQVRIKLTELGIRQIDLTNIDISEEFDIIVASQPEVNLTLLKHYNTNPFISIIHSEIRSEDPVLNKDIDHYIVIRESIKNLLINVYKIDESKVSLIYNPIDRTRFNPSNKKSTEKTTGVFVGEVLDSIRINTVNHLVQSCIKNDYILYLMSESKFDFNHPNIKYIPKTWNTENILKEVDFTAGILLGRTTLEGLCSDVPGYIYNIDSNGNILEIILRELDLNGTEFCDSKNVALQHINLYQQIIKKCS